MIIFPFDYYYKNNKIADEKNSFLECQWYKSNYEKRF